MKKTLLSIALGGLFLPLFAQQANTTVSGNLKGLSTEEWIYLSSFATQQVDSTRQNAKGFEFKLHIPKGEGSFYILKAGKGYENTAFVFLEPGKLQLSSPTANFSDAKFSGGKLADYYNRFEKRPKVEGLNELGKQLSEARQAGKEEESKVLGEAYMKKMAEQKELDKAFVLKNKKNGAAIYAMFFSMRGRDNYAEQEELLSQLAPKVKDNLPLKQMLHSIETDKLTGVGRTALDFTQNDTSGNPVSLQDFRGKYVLIDFWASWCVPCRVENPNVVSAFQQFKNKNFTVLGISFDNPGQHDRWIQAIHDDNLHWTQLSDLKGWKNEVGVLYDIKSIPSSLLLDPQGKIVAKNLRGEALENKLRELLGEPAMDKDTFVLNGKVENPDKASWFYFMYPGANGNFQTDSTRIFNGTFSYVGKMSSPMQVTAYFGKGDGVRPQNFEAYTSFYVEPGIVHINGNAAQPKDLSVEGGKVQAELKAYNELIEPQMAQLRPLNTAYNSGNQEFIQMRENGASAEQLDKKRAELDAIRAQMMPIHVEMSQSKMAYFKANPDSYITAQEMQYAVSSTPLEESIAIYSKMGEAVKKSPAGIAFGSELAKMKAGSPGSMATNFSDIDINGKPLQLTDFRGKYVLLDFWASWCVPCRKGNPHLLDLYSKYSKKGFEIIGVSDDDRNNDAWRKAVEQDKIGVWKHVLRGLKQNPDGGFDRSEDKSENYGIHSLPTKILIDPQGMIIGRYGGGGEDDAAMDKKLKEIFE